MMLKKDSESRARWKVLAMLPLACLALTAFAQRECGKDNIIYTDESHITLEYPSAEGTVSKQLHVLFNDSKTPARYLCADLSFNRFADIHTATLTVRPTNWADRTYNPNRFYIALDRTREPKAYDDIFDTSGNMRRNSMRPSRPNICNTPSHRNCDSTKAGTPCSST